MKNERATLIWAAAGAIFLAVLIYLALIYLALGR